MGYIKEPKEIDFVVDSTPLSSEDRKKISEIITFYKMTGRKTTITKSNQKESVKTITENIKIRRNKDVICT